MKKVYSRLHAFWKNKKIFFSPFWYIFLSKARPNYSAHAISEKVSESWGLFSSPVYITHGFNPSHRIPKRVRDGTGRVHWTWYDLNSTWQLGVMWLTITIMCTSPELKEILIFNFPLFRREGFLKVHITKVTKIEWFSCKETSKFFRFLKIKAIPDKNFISTGEGRVEKKIWKKKPF